MGNPDQPCDDALEATTETPDTARQPASGGFIDQRTMIREIDPNTPLLRVRSDVQQMVEEGGKEEVIVKELAALKPGSVICVHTQNSQYSFEVRGHYGDDMPIPGTALLCVGSNSKSIAEGRIMYTEPKTVIAQDMPMVFVGVNERGGQNMTSSLQKIEIIRPQAQDQDQPQQTA